MSSEETETEDAAWYETVEKPRLQAKICNDIVQERHRQEHLLAQGKFPWSCDDLTVPDIKKLGVLAEEFGEVAKEAAQIQEQYDRTWPGENEDVVAESLARSVRRRRGRLRAELVQVAAVCVAWCESLDRLALLDTSEGTGEMARLQEELIAAHERAGLRLRDDEGAPHEVALSALPPGSFAAEAMRIMGQAVPAPPARLVQTVQKLSAIGERAYSTLTDRERAILDRRAPQDVIPCQHLDSNGVQCEMRGPHERHAAPRAMAAHADRVVTAAACCCVDPVVVEHNAFDFADRSITIGDRVCMDPECPLEGRHPAHDPPLRSCSHCKLPIR